MKFNWKTILKTTGKVAAAGAATAVVSSPELQQTLLGAVNLIPPPWNAIVGGALGAGLYYARSPKTAAPAK